MTYPTIPAGRPPEPATWASEVRKLVNRVAELERKGAPATRSGAEWTLVVPLAITANTVTTLKNWGTVLRAPTGISVNTSTGVCTVATEGWWTLSCSLRVDAGAIKYLWFADGAGKYLYKLSNDAGGWNIGISHTHYFAANATFTVGFFASVNCNIVQEGSGDAVPVLTATCGGK